MTDKTPATITQPTALRMREAVRTCLDAERRRRAKLKDGAPASTYCDRRIAELEAALAQADAEVEAPPPQEPDIQTRLLRVARDALDWMPEGTADYDRARRAIAAAGGAA